MTDADDLGNKADVAHEPEGANEADSGSQDPAATVMALLAPGAPFEMADEDVLGEPMQVFVQRARSLRQLLAQAGRFGDSDYAVFHDVGRRRALTFADHERRVASVAAALADRGVGAGDRVAILAANCPEWIITFWATVSLGAVAVACNGWWTRDEIVHALAHTTPALLVADAKRLARLDGADPGMPVVVIEEDFVDLEGFAPDAALPDIPIDEDQPALLQFTSGTTGRSKAAVLSHRSVVAFVQVVTFLGAAQAASVGLPSTGPSRPRLAVFPMFHISGLQSASITPMATGAGNVWPMGRFDPATVIRLTTEEGIYAWNGTATHVFRLLQDPMIETLDVSLVQNVAIGGSATTPELVRATEERFPHLVDTFTSGYGLTESGGMVSHAGNAMLRANADSVGMAMPTVGVRIVDDDGDEVPDGENGSICVRSPLVMLGYWEDVEATDQAFLPGRWLRTGDYGRLQGGELFLASRLRDLILRGGENVYPIEVEARLEQHPAVAECAVYGVDHETLGQEVKAVVVLVDGASLDLVGARAFCGEKLADYKLPEYLEVWAGPLPRNAGGKVVKAVLRGEVTQAFFEE
ncbi:MAG: class I adenylate-forming enzyme family protein [Actinomycetota bacterium]|nr:class I adenylate-forming enzyme family protein [Actinomycetota bacterium]